MINGNTITAGASSTDTVATAGAAAAAAAAADGDVPESVMMSDDETIIQAADHSHYGDDN